MMEQDVVRFEVGVGVGDAVGQDVEPVVAVGRVEDGGQDDAAGADAPR